MNYVNSVTIQAIVSSTPVFRKTSNGSTYCVFTVSITENETTSNFDVLAWDNLALHCMKICEKENQIRVIGKLKECRMFDSTNNKHSYVKIIAQEVIEC